MMQPMIESWAGARSAAGGCAGRAGPGICRACSPTLCNTMYYTILLCNATSYTMLTYYDIIRYYIILYYAMLYAITA